jgi:hypothetical protein
VNNIKALPQTGKPVFLSLLSIICVDGTHLSLSLSDSPVDETFRVVFHLFRITIPANHLVRTFFSFACHPTTYIRFLLLLLFLSFDPLIAVAGTNSWFPGMTNAPAIVPALPTNFTAVALGPGAKTNHTVDLQQGLLWASKSAAVSLEFSDVRQLATAAEPLFHLALSRNIKRKAGTDTFTDEQDMVHYYTPRGDGECEILKDQWGPYPIFIITSQRPDGSCFYNAWLGLNTPDSQTIAINYRIPRGEGHPNAEERAIWDTFVKDTQGK